MVDRCLTSIFFALCVDLTDPTADLCKQFGAEDGRPVFERIDVYRGEVGHTFMSCDKIPDNVRRTSRTKQYIVDINGDAEIIRGCDRGRFNVTFIKASDGFLGHQGLSDSIIQARWRSCGYS